MQDGFHLFLRPASARAQFTPYARKLDARVVEQIAVLVDAVFQPAFQLPENLDALCLLLDERQVHLHFFEEALDGSHRAHRAQKISKIVEVEHGTALGLCQRLTDVEDTTHGR